MATEESSGSDMRRGIRGYIVLLAGAAASLGALTFLGGHGWQTLWWHEGELTILFAATYLSLVLSSRIRRWVWAALAGFVLFSASAIVLDSLAAHARRASFPWNNPNTAAAVLVSGVGVVVLSPVSRAVKLPVAVLAGIALVTTGSRTGLIAAVPLLLALPGSRPRAWYVHATWGLVLACSILYIAGCAVEMQSVNSKNLLRFSNQPQSAAWAVTAWRSIEQIAGETWPGRFQRMELARQSKGRFLLLSQTAETSHVDTPYTASVLLRGELQSQVILSTNLSRAECQVISVWTRCVTPPGWGDGTEPVRFQIQVIGPGGPGHLDIALPQLERSTQATRPVPTDAGAIRAIAGHIPIRLNIFAKAAHLDDFGKRWAAWRIAWSAFRERPILGYGVDNVQSIYIGRDEAAARQPNDLVLWMLIAFGASGTAVWIIVALATLAQVQRAVSHRALPVFLAIALLNLTDATLFAAGVYVPTVLGMSLLMSSKSQPKRTSR